MGPNGHVRDSARAGAARGLVATEVEPGHFLEGSRVGLRIAPFVSIGLVPLALLPVAGVSPLDWRILVGYGLVPFIVAAAILPNWERHPVWLQSVVPLPFFITFALLRDAAGGAPSAFDPIIVLPIAWFSIYGTGRWLAAVVALMALVLIVPIVAIGAPSYPASELIRAILIVALSAVLGGVVHSLIGALRDSRRALREADTRFRRAFEDSGMPMAMLRPNGAFLRANPAMTVLTGREERELRKLSLDGISALDDLATDYEERIELLEGERESFRSERRLVGKGGHSRWVSATISAVRDDDDEIAYLIGQFEDVTGRRDAEQRLRLEAMHDPLTRLPNRTLFEDRLKRALSRTGGGDELGVIYVDLDGFKEVNDVHGHAIGDELLVAVADRLLHTLREADTLARIGGDELAVLAEKLGPGELETVAERIVAALEQPFALSGVSISQKASIGLAATTGGPGSISGETLVDQADTAMYAAKSRGGDHWVRHGAMSRDGEPEEIVSIRAVESGV